MEIRVKTKRLLVLQNPLFLIKPTRIFMHEIVASMITLFSNTSNLLFACYIAMMICQGKFPKKEYVTIWEEAD